MPNVTPASPLLQKEEEEEEIKKKIFCFLCFEFFLYFYFL